MNLVLVGLFTLFLSQAPAGDIDAFMEKVLERRDVNWEQYHEYFGKERAELVVEGSLPGVPLTGFEKEYLWFVRDGYMVRSPVSVDGVEISTQERAREEEKWIERVKKRERERSPDREGFMGFKFEPGNYFYAGTEMFEGTELVSVEYYPEEGFAGDDEEDQDERDQELARQFNKTLMVTMLIDPEDHQIVRMTVDNFGFDFLPGGWLVKLDTFEATMVMHKPFEDVWLPRDIEGYGKVTTAAGSISVRYTTTFYDYAKAETGATYRFPARGLNEHRDEQDEPKR
jgi:hypothetical protein